MLLAYFSVKYILTPAMNSPLVAADIAELPILCKITTRSIAVRSSV